MRADESAADRKDLDKVQSLLQRLSRKISETCEKNQDAQAAAPGRGEFTTSAAVMCCRNRWTARKNADALRPMRRAATRHRSMLIEHNLRLVVYIAKKFENAGINVEDLISIGTIGLIKAVNTFKVDKNIKLATHASRCIENEILMYLRRSTKRKSEVSLDEPLNVDWDGNELLLSDILGTENDIVSQHLEEEVNRSLLYSAMEKPHAARA